MGFLFGSQQSVAALLVCMEVGRKGERAMILLLRFCHSNFPEQGARIGVFFGSLPSAAALLVCMSVGREGKRAKLVFVWRSHRS